MVAKLDAAAVTVSSEGTPVRLLVTLSVPADEVLYGVFGAHSPDIVSRTCLQAGVPHQRLSGGRHADSSNHPPARLPIVTRNLICRRPSKL